MGLKACSLLVTGLARTGLARRLYGFHPYPCHLSAVDPSKSESNGDHPPPPYGRHSYQLLGAEEDSSEGRGVEERGVEGVEERG